MAKTYEAMLKGEGPPKSGGRFLDLKNRQQTGDLEKKILYYKQKNNYKVFNFTSCRGKDGVSTVLANLINYFKLQKSDKKILIIDANFQRPSLHEIFGVANMQGLTDALSNVESYSQMLTPIDSTNISLLTCGKDYQGYSGNLNQEKFSDLLEVSKEQYEFIFIDSAPILSSSDGLSTAAASDVTFLVVQSLSVQQEVALKTKTLLLDNECIVAGVILNRIRQVIPEWAYRIL